MRIACIHVPQFALQCQTRIDPGLRGAAVAMAGSPASRQAPVITACARAAWALGVRIGMTAPTARALSPDVVVVPADAALERETVRALADVLLALSPVVDAGGRVGGAVAHLAMYCEVPSKTRGTSFGERVLAQLAALGIAARVGIADDRFTAWVAAHEHSQASRAEDVGVTSVPRGGSAAFLAPRPLSLLGISPEVQHMLEALGVATLGAFAGLPAPSQCVVRPRPLEADYQALARGESGHVLRPYAPEAPIREEVVIASRDSLPASSAAEGRRGSIAPATSAPAAVALLAERVALRLAGRTRAAARIEVTALGEAGERMVPLALAAASAGELADAIGTALAGHPSPWRVRVSVIGEVLLGEPAVAEAASPAALVEPAAAVAAVPPLDTTLAVVLSSTGALGLRAERRDLHRGTRRGKQRRRTATAEALLQPRLFKG